MKVLVTGAAGNLGSHTCHALAKAGHETVAIDHLAREVLLPTPLHVVNLLDYPALEKISHGCDAVVHLGAYTYMRRDLPDATVFNENVAMTFNAFQAGLKNGAKRMIFASSVHAMTGDHWPVERAGFGELPYLPVDGKAPTRPHNPYGLSKQLGEQILEYFSREFGVTGVALRFPWLLTLEQLHKREPLPVTSLNMRGFGFTYLTYNDGASLIESILRSDVKGFHTWLPADPNPCTRETPRELITSVYADVPRRKPADDIQSIVDISEITQATGWAPASN